MATPPELALTSMGGPRPWDRFLTERDRALSTARPAPQPRLGERPALLLVDLYRWVFGDRPEPLLDAIGAWPASCGEAAWAAIGPIQDVLAAARAAGTPVVHATGVEGFPRTGRGDRVDPAARVDAGDPKAEDRRRRAYDLMPEVAPIEGEAVIPKAGASAFWGTPLSGHLRYHGVDTLIVVGESTSGCVRATVVDAQAERFHVAVPEACVFDRYEASHAMALFDLEQRAARLLSTEATIGYLRDGVEPA